MKKEKAIRRITKAIRKYYFEILDENTLRSREGVIYRWNSEQNRKFNLTLREAVEKVLEGISKYYVERSSPNQRSAGEKLFRGKLFYKPGIGLLAASFPEGLIRIMGRYAIPTEDILSFARNFYLSFSLPERKYYLELLREIERSAEKG